uniref:Uncharacterized protein n=1 Tax=Oryza glumipatula TaxID=40148 RepID=A0A0E0A9G2_9ORYZ
MEKMHERTKTAIIERPNQAKPARCKPRSSCLAPTLCRLASRSRPARAAPHTPHARTSSHEDEQTNECPDDTSSFPLS